MLRYVPLRDRSLGIQQTASPRGTLNNTYFQAMLERGNSFTRTTAGNRVLTYILEVIQQPERARACGIGAKLSADRAPVDPPPVVQLSIFELRNGVQTDVSFSYDASFFIFASLEVAQAVDPGRPHLDKNDFFNPATVLTGTRVCSAAYLDRPNPAMFFIFPDLSVRHEGRYRFCFNLYETTKHLEDYDINQPGGDLSIVSEHSTNPNNSTEDCHWRMDIQSAPFTIYSAKKYPGLAQSTVLSGTVAEQGCRVRIRRDVRLWSGRRRNRSSMEDEGELSPPYELGLPVPPRAIHENDITTTGPIAVYPDILNKEITKSPEVQYQQGLGSSVQLSHSETIFASNKEPSLNRSAGTENNYTPDDALSQESTAEYPLSITNNDIPSQDHDRHSRQKTQEGGRSSLSRNGPMWESLKQDIYRVYITENNTLLETMPRFEQAHGLKASSRKWKEKLKKWGFEKYPKARDMQFVIAKADSRKKKAGKDTTFFYNGVQIPVNKIENFKKRRTMRETNPTSPSPPTPEPITYHTPRSDAESSMSSDDTIALDDNLHDLNFLASGSPTATRKELIWSALIKCGGGEIKATSVKYSANETAITAVNGEPLSQAIKRSSQEWWLAHSSERWENILPEQDIIFFDRHLLYLIFSSWHQDWMAGPSGLRKDGHWLRSLGSTFDQERLVEQLVQDIFLYLHRAAAGSVKRTAAESSASDVPSGSTTAPHQKSYESSKTTGKRRDRHDAEQGEDGLDGDDPNQNDRTKRVKKTMDEYNRYVICTQFAAGQEPARPNCFFGAWCSVDRLKQDHLVKVHKFEISQMQIDRGGTEPEKWWRLFDKLNPGFREANPEKFIPGPFYEDRVAHNTYNKIFSEAMKRAEGIQQRRAQNLALDIQDLLNRHRDGETQEIRQVVLDVLHSQNPDTSSGESLSVMETMESETGNFHNASGRISTPLLQLLATEPTSSSTSSNSRLPVASQIDAPGHANSSIEPSLHGNFWDGSNPPAASLWRLTHNDLGMDARHTHNSIPPESSEILRGYGADTAIATTSSSEAMSGNFPAANNNLDLQQPFGKVCRCRFHNTECDHGVRDGNEWCTCCSGWFPWSAFAEPFIIP